MNDTLTGSGGGGSASSSPSGLTHGATSGETAWVRRERRGGAGRGQRLAIYDGTQKRLDEGSLGAGGRGVGTRTLMATFMVNGGGPASSGASASPSGLAASSSLMAWLCDDPEHTW